MQLCRPVAATTRRSPRRYTRWWSRVSRSWCELDWSPILEGVYNLASLYCVTYHGLNPASQAPLRRLNARFNPRLVMLWIS